MKKLYFSLLFLLFVLGYQTMYSQNYVEFYVMYNDTCGPVNVTFVNNSYLPDTVSPTYIEWYINGNLYSTQFNPPDTVMPAGYHNVNLWVWDEAGFASDYYQDFYIQGFGNITVVPEEICPNEEVRFHMDGNADWVIWKFPNGETSNQWDETYIFDSPGTYTIKAIGATWECGLDSTSRDVVVDVGAVPRAEIWINGNWFCPNDEIKFSSPEAAGHMWAINGDTIYGQEIFYAFSDTGQYTISLTTSNGCGNTNTVTDMVYISLDNYPNAWFDYNFGDNPNCPNYQITFEAQASGQFEWDFGDGSFAYDRIVYNTYSDTGIYEVKLITRNGCGYTDTIIQEVYVDYDPYNIPYAEIRFEDRDSYLDTLNVCPGTEVHLESDTYGNDDVELTWHVDGTTFTSQNLIYTFSTPGLNEIMLITTNRCMNSDTAYKYVVVDENMTPIVDLRTAPFEICLDEQVYFWDEGGHDDWNMDYIQNLIFKIDFGDGNILSNITGQTVDFPPVLAAHQYNTLDTFHYIFTAQNTCGNEDTLKGDIIVSDDAARLPFYYIGNSTNDEEGGQMEDWSMPVPNSHEFVIPVNILDWNYMYPMDSTAYIFLWYGHIDPMGEDPGPPDGIVEIKVPDTVSVYVPFNVLEPSVGVAAVWYCNPGDFDSEPQLYSLPLDVSFNEIQSFPLQENGYTDFRVHPDIAQQMTLDGMYWTDGPCMTTSSKIRGRWYYQADQKYYVALGIWEEGEGILMYDISYGPDRWDTRTFVSYGELTQLDDTTLQFMEIDGRCATTDFEYYAYINESNDQMTLVNNTDDCTERLDLLTPKPFMRDDDDWDYDYQYDRTGCPGDSLEFYIAGGLSYEWFLTDGYTTTEAHFYHAYADTGKYEELVVATNACSRIDSIYTTVIIDTTNVPEAYWWTDKWDIRRMEPVQFFPENDNDDLGNNVYLWEFGDGTSSTEKTPIHYYTYEGEYNVTLTVTNGCGSSTETWPIYVRKETASCIAKFTFTISDKTVSFKNNSIGGISSFVWDFGDGKISNKANPVHTYTDYGIYEVSLFVHDTITGCSDEISVMLTLGTVVCFSNFTYVVNETTNKVIFTEESQGDITSWFWEFGDGTTSTDTFPSHTYNHPGIYPVCLTVINEASGCISTNCKEITVGEVDLYAKFNYFVDPGTTTVTFSDISDGDITNWYWEFGDGDWDTIPNTTHIYDKPGEYYVCLGVYNYNTGAFDDVCKDVIVVADTNEVVTKAKFNYIVIPGTNKVKFLDNSTGDVTSWYWTFGDGTYASGDTVEHTYSSPGLYNVCLTVYNSTTGERSEVCKTVQAGTLPCNINAEFGYYINQNTREVTFNDKSTGNVNAWFWDFGNGKTSTRKSPKHIYSQPGFYLVSLAVRDTVNNCTDYYADFIQVGAAECIADFSFTITDASTNAVEFTDKSVGDIGDWFWYFDDGSFSTDTNPSHTYDEPGLYMVSLTTTDVTGTCYDFRIKDVQVGTVECDATFTVYVDSTTNKAYFTNSSYGSATDYYWLFGDGTFHIGPNPVHQYVAPGYFTVSLNTFNDVNGCIDYYEDVILIGSSGDDVEADFYYQADFSTGEVKFFNESLGENLTYIWDFGDGNTSTDENPTHQFVEGGYQFVCLTATNSVTGALKTTCKLVQSSNQAEDDCLAKFNYDIDTTTLEVTFIDKSYGDPDVYAWDFGDGSTSTSSDPVHQYTQENFYSVKLYTYNSTTDCESYEYQYINVGVDNDSIQAFFTYELDTATAKFGSKGKPADIWGQSHGGGSKLSWSYGDAKKDEGKVTATTLRPKHVYENPGIYNCCLTIEDPVIDQSDTYCAEIMVPYEMIVSASICDGDTYDFMGTDLSAAGSYLDTTTSVIGVDSIVSLTLTVNPVPVKPTITEDNNVLTASIADGYQWYKDGAAITGATNQTYTPTESGDYHVVVTNSFGCESDASNTVTVSLSGIDVISKFDIKIFPNPMRDYTRINYKLLSTSQVSVKVFDASGNQVANLVNTYKPAGNHEIIWRNTGLANGVYYLVIQSGEDQVTNKIIIQK